MLLLHRGEGGAASTRLSSERERVRGGVKSGQWPIR